MDRVQDLPPEINRSASGRDLIILDGLYVPCSGFFRLTSKHDHNGRFTFATAQSEFGGSLNRALGLSDTDFETKMVVTHGRIWRKLDAFATAVAVLGWPWKVLAVLKHLPRPEKDPIYDLIARNRYRIFGRYDNCLLPNPDLRARFLDNLTE